MVMVALDSTQEFISDEMLQEISSVDGVAGYDGSIVSMPYYFKETGESVVTTGYTNSFILMALLIRSITIYLRLGDLN